MSDKNYLFSLSTILFSRFIAIKFPFRYCELFSPTNSKKAIVLVWIVSGVWSVVGIFNWRSNGDTFGVDVNKICYNSNKDYYAASSFGIYLSVLIVMTGTYITILHVACSHIQAIEASQVTLRRSDYSRPTVSTRASLIPPGNNNTENNSVEAACKKRKRTLYKELKATKSVAIVYLAYVVCWLPCYIINIIIYIDIGYFPKLKNKDPTLFLFLYYAFIEVLPSVNTMVNPFIYSFSNNKFRTEVKLLLVKVFRLKLDVHDRNSPFFEVNSSSHVSPSLSRTGTPVKGRRATTTY